MLWTQDFLFFKPPPLAFSSPHACSCPAPSPTLEVHGAAYPSQWTRPGPWGLALHVAACVGTLLPVLVAPCLCLAPSDVSHAVLCFLPCSGSPEEPQDPHEA